MTNILVAIDPELESAETKEALNSYLSLEMEGDFPLGEHPISADWPYTLKFVGRAMVKAKNKRNILVDGYLLKPHKWKDEHFAYAESRQDKGKWVTTLGVKSTKGRTFGQFLEEEYPDTDTLKF